MFFQAVSGIALPSASDKLYSGGKDGTVRLWDCQTGQVTMLLIIIHVGSVYLLIKQNLLKSMSLI